MHRSGTSLLARILSEKDICLGKKLNDSPSYGNPSGHYEDRTVVSINKRFLSMHQGCWHRLPEHLNPQGVYKKILQMLNRLRLVRHVKRRSEEQVWSFKDPRTCITYPLWKRALQNMDVKIIGIFRHYDSVVSSLVNRDAMKPEKALDLWVQYNQYLLYHLKRASSYILIQYKDLVNKPDKISQILNSEVEGNQVKVKNLVKEREHAGFQVQQESIPESILAKLQDHAV